MLASRNYFTPGTPVPYKDAPADRDDFDDSEIQDESDIDSELEASLYAKVYHRDLDLSVADGTTAEPVDEDVQVLWDSKKDKRDQSTGNSRISFFGASFDDGDDENGDDEDRAIKSEITSNVSGLIGPRKRRKIERDVVERFESVPREQWIETFSIQEIQLRLGGWADDWRIRDEDRGTSSGGRYFGKRRGLECRRCREFGHRLRDCKTVVRLCCQYCGDEHKATRCHYKARFCIMCFRPGHFPQTCPEGVEELRKRICRRCGYRGHFEQACPEQWRQFHSTTSMDGGLQYHGLLSNGPGRSRPNFCYNCGGEGHLGHECWRPSVYDGRLICFNPLVSVATNHQPTLPSSSSHKRFDNSGIEQGPKVENHPTAMNGTDTKYEQKIGKLADRLEQLLARFERDDYMTKITKKQLRKWRIQRIKQFEVQLENVGKKKKKERIEKRIRLLKSTSADATEWTDWAQHEQMAMIKNRKLLMKCKEQLTTEHVDKKKNRILKTLNRACNQLDMCLQDLRMTRYCSTNGDGGSVQENKPKNAKKMKKNAKKKARKALNSTSSHGKQAVSVKVEELPTNPDVKVDSSALSALRDGASHQNGIKVKERIVIGKKRLPISPEADTIAGRVKKRRIDPISSDSVVINPNAGQTPTMDQNKNKMESKRDKKMSNPLEYLKKERTISQW